MSTDCAVGSYLINLSAGSVELEELEELGLPLPFALSPALTVSAAAVAAAVVVVVITITLGVNFRTHHFHRALFH